MIHVIPHHIGKGSWVGWYDIIKFDQMETVKFYNIEDTETIEHKLPYSPPYTSLLQKQLDIIKNNFCGDDIIFIDCAYVPSEDLHDNFESYMSKLSDKYKCKFVIVDGDNTKFYKDTTKYTYFSNKFKLGDKLNFDYFRYRTPFYENLKFFRKFNDDFKHNYKQKKINFIVGVDKPDRLLVLKRIIKLGLDKDGYIGYSGFSKNYSDNEISENLLDFRNKNLPIILDTPYERSTNGAVSCQTPPFPITMNSYVSCICETQILLNDDLHISEKSYNPFISMNIPLLLGSQKLNEYFIKEGYWMAEDLFDLSPIPPTRNHIINRYFKNLEIINNMSMKDLHDYYDSNVKNMEWNHDLLMRQEFVYDSNFYKKLS